MIREGISWMHLLLVGCCLIGALGGQGRSSCNTIACPKTRNYICGSDGKTYRNECQLQKRACKGPHIDIAYDGRCGSASKRKRELVIGGYEWNLAAKVVPRGSPTSVIVNVSVTLNDNGGSVHGVNLWRLGIFGSQWNDGWGERKNEMVQILNTAQQNQPARGGTPLEFLNVEGDFDYTELGCNDEFGYLCLEVSKGSQARPDFQLQVFTFQDSLIICERVTCQEPVTPPCVHACPDDSTPVCGSDGRTYPNNCEIENEIRCHPNASLEVVFEDRCDAGVTVNSIFWSVEATSYVRRGPSQLLLDAIVLTNGTVDVSGTGLWRLGIFGSQNLDGSGPRLDYQHQLLNSTQAAMPLVAALPINLHFEVPVEFNVAKLGCSVYKALCLEFAKGDNAAPDFSFRASSGKAIFIGCRTTPCNGPEDDGTGRLRASIYTFNWGLRAAGSAIRGEPVDVQLSVSVPTSPDSNDITGSNLWRIGLYGSNRANGMGDERFGYIRQTITDDQVSNPLIYPTNMEFLINTRFIITGIGCGDYPYLCVELAKADDPQPNFILNDGGDPTSICQRVPCNDAAANNDNTQSPSVARLSNLNWNLEIEHLVYGSPSNITLQVTVLPVDSTDSIAGEGLWRLGIYFSTSSDGRGERYGYTNQLLPTDYTNMPLASRVPLVFLDVIALLDVTGLGCNNWRFVCIEFAKGEDPRPDFELPLPGGEDFAVSCRSFPCTNGGGENAGDDGRVTEPEYVPGNSNPHVDPNTQGDGTGQDVPSVSVSSIRISNFRSTVTRVQFLLAVTPGRLSQFIEGEGLWRIGLYASSDRNGEDIGTPHTRQVLNSRSHSKSLRPPSQLVFDIDADFQMQQIGCGNMRFLCIEFGKGDNPVPDFNLILPGSDTVVTCQLMPCDAPPNIVPYTPNNNNNNNNDDDNQPGYNQPDLSNTGSAFAYLTGLSWTMQPIIIRNDARSLIRLRIAAPISNTSDTIRGRGLWRVALFGSVDSLGSEPRFDYHHQILRQEDQNEVAMPYNNLSFNAIIDFDLMGLGCSQYLYLCIEFSKGDNPVPGFYLPLANGASSITSCQRARCLNPNIAQQATAAPQQQQKTAHLARFSWEMNPLLKNPDGPSDVSFSLTLTPQPNTDIITGTGLWRVGIFGSKTEGGSEPRTSYKRQVLNQLHTSQPLQGPTTFDIQTTLDMTEMGCGPYKFFCVEFAKGDNPQPEFNMPLNGGDALVNCQHVPCRNTNRQRPYKTRPPPPPPPKPDTHANQVSRPDPQPTRKPATPTIATPRPQRLTTQTPYHHMWPTMSRPGVTNRPVLQHPNYQTRPRPPIIPNQARPHTTRPHTTRSEQEDQPRSTNNPIYPANSNTHQLDPHFNKPNSNPQLQPQQPLYPKPQPQSNSRPETNSNLPRQRYVPFPGRKVVWFAAIRWKASIEQVFQDGSQEINLEVMLIPHNNRVNAVMGSGMWRMGIFGASDSDGSGLRHDYKNQILNSFDQSNPLIPPNFLQFDVDTEFDIKSVGCGQYKYVCLEFDKAETSSIEFDLVVEDGVLGPIISCQAAPCSSSSAFLTTSGPPTTTRPQVLIRNIFPEEVAITEGAQNQLDVDVEVIYDQLSDDVTGNNMWRLELWTSAKSDGSGTRVVSLDQSLTDEQSSKDLVKPYPLTFTNIRMDLDMRANRCSYVRYICARLSNSRHGSTFDLSAEAGDIALTGCSRTQCLRAQGSVSHPSTRPLVKFSGITVGIPTIEENVLNKLALRVNLHVPMDSDAVSGSQLWRLAVWGSKKANGGGQRYSSNNQALIPRQADMSVIPPSDLVFEYVRFNLDMTRVRCKDISYVCVAISIESTTFDLQGVPNDLSLTGCTTITCETASVPELVVNSVALILPPTPIVAGQSNPMTMDFEIVYDVGNSVAVNGNNNWRVKIWGSDRANGGGARLSQSTQALTRQQASQPLMIGRPFTIRGIEYVMNLRGVYCRDVGFVCAQLVAGNNSFRLRPIPNKKSLITCQRLHCING